MPTGTTAPDNWTDILDEAPQPGGDQLLLASQLATTTQKVFGLNQSLNNLIDGCEQQIADLQARLDNDTKLYAAKNANAFSADTLHSVKTVRQGEADAGVKQLRAELIDKTKTSRNDMLSQSGAADDHAARVIATFAPDGKLSVRKFLSVLGVGSPERSRYAADVKGAGPAEISTHVNNVSLTKNPIYAAAVLREIENLPTKLRPVSPEEFADNIVGDRARQVIASANFVRNLHRQANERNTNFILGRNDSPNSRIARGLLAEQARNTALKEKQKAMGFD